MTAPPRILIIRHSALGDLVQSFPLFAAIRAHHPQARISLLTTAPYAGWMARARWFDAVVVDPRPSLANPSALWRLVRQMRGFHRIYDLQTSVRSTRYAWLAGRAEWSGIGRFASHPHRNPDRDRIHTFDRQREQLRDAGITTVPILGPADLAPLADVPDLALPAAPYALLVPGAAPHRPEKRWPEAHFATLAAMLVARGQKVVIAGTAAEAPLAAAIRASVPEAIDATGRTGLPALMGLIGRAGRVIGNDTGPMHLATLLGRPTLVLFGGASDPALTAPRTQDGAWPCVLAAPHLADLSPERVAAALWAP